MFLWNFLHLFQKDFLKKALARAYTHVAPWGSPGWLWRDMQYHTTQKRLGVIPSLLITNLLFIFLDYYWGIVH